MTLPARTKTNRANAQKSTGPTSQGGKAAAKHNALKHGIHAQTPTLAHEDPAQFKALAEDIYAELAPETTMESQIADRIIMTLIRQRRLRQAETATIQQSIDQAIQTLTPSVMRDEALERLHQELHAINFHIDPDNLDPLKTLAPNILERIGIPPDSMEQMYSENDPTFKHNVLNHRFRELKNTVAQYIDSQNSAQISNIRARQLVPYTPEMQFLTRYQVQLDNDLIKLLKLYDDSQIKRRQREAIEIN